MKLKTRKQVIKEFMLIHFDTYDYSKVEYKNAITKVTIICRTHGPFEQIPNSHKRGRGCSECGKLKCVRRKPLFGVGINDSDYITNYTDKYGNSKTCPYYSRWCSMLNRCYSSNYHIRNPTYIGCTVSKEWLTFSNFKKWMETQDYIGKDLDKDILIEGNKVYSKDTCCFVSSDINSLLVDNKAARGKYPVGVCLHKPSDKYRAQISINGKVKNLGYHTTIQEASNTYNIAKANYIIEKANELKDIRVKEALIKIANNLKVVCYT